ncbi:hypothetical protein NicSoilB8_07240 [Arthrobacter sp. NicSoilB8]|nr:hypothetical protein NicSoilB8_07240 [Arthrobacter sp. NicSoilB8]
MTVTVQSAGYVKEMWPSGKVNVAIGADWRVSEAGAAVSLAAGAPVAVAATLGESSTVAAGGLRGVAFGSVLARGTAQAAAVSRTPVRVAAARRQVMRLFKLSPNLSAGCEPGLRSVDH